MILETDLLHFVLLWVSRRQCSEVAVIMADTEQMIEPLISVDVVHVKPSTNGAARLCAKFAASSRSSVLWHDQPPSFLLPTLLSDCNQLIE